MSKKAVFLDRDGVLNDPGENYYVWKIKDFKINTHIYEQLIKYSNAGYLLIVISNQGGIAKGIYTKSDTETVHNFMASEFEKHGIILSEIYYCPHHEQKGKCLCRKPNSLMIEKAAARFSIDLSQSILIGDSMRDIEAAQRIGLKGILIKKNGNLPNLFT